jgi:hypothetical protein
LQIAGAEAVVKALVGLLLAAAVLIVMRAAFFTPGPVTSSQIQAPALTPASADYGVVTPHRAPTADDSAVDLYGNEVSDAIATYSLDPAGSLYELHSPQTELPKLGPPKS